MGDPEASLALLEAPVGAWLPDETVFSFASRHHRLSGNVADSTTCVQLFGHRAHDQAHDFPSRLEELAVRAKAALGSVESIIAQHTVLPYYLPFRSPEEGRDATRALIDPPRGSPRTRSALVAGPFHVSHPLKACEQCIREDAERHCVAYWHVAHQLPGCWICPEHRCLLDVYGGRGGSAAPNGWCLPSVDRYRSMEKRRPSVTAAQTNLLWALSEAAVGLWSLPGAFHFDPDQLLRTYLLGLQARGFARASGRLHSAEIGSSYAVFVAHLQFIPEIALLPRAPAELLTELRRMSQGLRHRAHPLRHLIFILWLFGSWSDFHRKVDTSLSAAKLQGWPLTKAVLGARIAANNERSSTELPQSRSATASSVESQLRNRSTALPKNSFRTGRTPTLRGPRRRRVVALLRKGLDLAFVASTTGMSVATIRRTLTVEAGLARQWRVGRRRLLRNEARAAWRAAIRDNPRLPVRHLRLIAATSFVWLRLHDAAWIKESIAAIERDVHRWSEPLVVESDGQDADLAQRVYAVALALAEQRGHGRTSWRKILAALPELQARLGDLERLPMTRKAIDLALAARFDFSDQLPFPESAGPA